MVLVGDDPASQIYVRSKGEQSRAAGMHSVTERLPADATQSEVIALVRPANERAVATVRRIGMQWVGETEKYHDLRLQQYRLRPADLAREV